MISDEAVEAAAIASYVRAGGGTPESWQREEDYYRREYLEDARVQLEAAAPYIAARAWEDGAEAGFSVTREGFNNECAFEHLADDDYPPTNPYSGQQWLIDGSAEARRG